MDFPIYNANGSPFHDLVLHKATMQSVVMSLGDKITGDVVYTNASLANEDLTNIYIVYNNVKYTLVNPPTIVQEGMVSDNSEMKGMVKYFFEFYHPMLCLSNFCFSDIAVSDDEEAYLSQNKTFSWIGTLEDFVAKINANLKGTEWIADISDDLEVQEKKTVMSEVLTFDKNYVSDALKKAYDTWEVPFVIDQTSDYGEDKKFLILFGLPSNEILDDEAIHVVETDVAMYGGIYRSSTPIELHAGWSIEVLSSATGGSVYIVESDGDTFMVDETTHTAITSFTSAIDTTVYVASSGSAEVTYKVTEVFVFRFGQGVGLKNNSRTPRNNKIITRLAGYGSENNIPWGYPQIEWQGNPDATCTIGDSVGPKENVTINGKFFEKAMSYPIYKGIKNGQWVSLIKHPFTRKTLMPPVYVADVNNKVNPYAHDYDPETVIHDYYDADDLTIYPNPINLKIPSYEIHGFDDIKPELGEAFLVDVSPYSELYSNYISVADFDTAITNVINNTPKLTDKEKGYLRKLKDMIDRGKGGSMSSTLPAKYTIEGFNEKGGSIAAVGEESCYLVAKYESDLLNLKYTVWWGQGTPSIDWDDTMNDDGEYLQSYFKVTLPTFDFDLYACASLTEKMDINMRSGACLGCTFPIMIDWEDYKRNFYNADGEFDPVIHTTQGDGHVRDGSKYPNSMTTQISVIVQKDLDTFGTLMPNRYQTIAGGDQFVLLGISLPDSYIATAQQRLESAMKEYMLENNVHYYDYPLKFDEHFLVTHTDILSQLHNNTIVRFEYVGTMLALYVKQMTIKYGQSVLPQYDITLTDDVEIVLNKIGQVTDDVSRMRVQVSALQSYYGKNLTDELNKRLSRVADDVAAGRITFQQGLISLGDAIFTADVRTNDFINGLYNGKGWRIDRYGNAEFESLLVRSYLEVIELLINRMSAQEGDTVFTDNDQIDYVEEGTHPILGTYYILSFKEKWEGYVSSQQPGNILKGMINTLAALEKGYSEVTEEQSVESDGANKYYVSWMKVVDPTDYGLTLQPNQAVVTLYADVDTPAQKNFPPCKLMTIARWGCYYNAEDPSFTPAQRESIIRRQRSFVISTKDGRITKMRGVNQPILQESNYGTTLGIIPEFIQNWSIYPSLIANRDYLYAQGVIVGDFIKVDINGDPFINIVDKGDWQDNTPYYHEAYNPVDMEWQTSDVWHGGERWRCMVTQPVNGVYYEPTNANSMYWRKMLSKGPRGRMPYYWGKWEDFVADNTNRVNVTDNETPYFSKQRGDGSGLENFWVFVGENSPAGGYAPTDIDTPSVVSTQWEQMVTDFKYLITEALFADFAKLGSGVFFGDWLLSQNGTLYPAGTESDVYTKFSPDFPTNETIVPFEGDLTTHNPDANIIITSTAYNNRLLQQTFIMKGGMQYDIEVYAWMNTSLTMTIGLRSVIYSDDLIGSFTVASDDPTFDYHLLVTMPYDSEVYLCAYANTAGSEGEVSRVAITPIGDFTPKMAIDLKTGYSHFAGGSIVMRPDGMVTMSGETKISHLEIQKVLEMPPMKITMANFSDWHDAVSGGVYDALYMSNLPSPVIEYDYCGGSIINIDPNKSSLEVGTEITIVNLTTSDFTITNTLYYDSTESTLSDRIRTNNYLFLQPFDSVTLRCADVSFLLNSLTTVKCWVVKSHQKNNNI